MRQSPATIARPSTKARPRVVRRASAARPSGPHADQKTFGVLHAMTMASIAKDVQRLKKK